MIRVTAALMAALMTVCTVTGNPAMTGTGTIKREAASTASSASEAFTASTASSASEAGTADGPAPEKEPVTEESETLYDQVPDRVPELPQNSAAGRRVVREAILVNELLDDFSGRMIRRARRRIGGSKAALDEKMLRLYEELGEEIDDQYGDWALYLKKLDDGQTIGINEDRQMVAASLIKLFIAGAYYTAVQKGAVDASRFGNDPDVMLSRSDNDATNRLIDALSKEKINAFIKHWTLSADPLTVLNRKMLENNGTENYTTAGDCGRMLEAVLKGRYVSREASERILQDLKDQERTWKIPAGVPEGVETANKTGELTGVENDAAIIWGPGCTYILCILSSGAGGGVGEIVELSKIVYDALCTEP